jgi:hypothetical protein
MTTAPPHDSPPFLAPRFGTERHPERVTHGSRIAEIGQALGTGLMPWQRYVADVAGEVDPATDRLYYSQVVVLVPRQSGKTTLGLAVRAERALGFGGPQNLLYTAQTRNDARMKWEDDHWPILRDSPLGPLVDIRRRTGAEAFVWSNGSIDGLPAPTEKAGHGKTLDLAFADEAFAQIDDRLEQAFRPAMITRPEPQLWVVSTAGTEKSSWLKGKVDAGRRRLLEGDTASRTAYFEWSAPNDAPIDDPGTWRACMPALGITINEQQIKSVFDNMIAEQGMDGLGLFRRAYLNQWPDAYQRAWTVIGELQWRACGGARAEPRPEGQVAFGVDASWPDGAWCSISVATLTDDDRTYVQVLERREGTSWVVPVLKELTERHRPWATVVDRKGPAGSLIPDMEAAGLEVETPSLEAIAHAAFRVKADVCADIPTLRHYDQDELDDAVAMVSRRPLGDAWTWARRNDTDISPLTSVTLAVHGLTDAGGLIPWAMTI